jgi:hypothetical protein
MGDRKVELQVIVKSVYGTPRIYPVNDAAKALAELCSQRTINANALNIAITRLGHTVKYLTPGVDDVGGAQS